MQAWYDARFERDMGFTADEFRRCLPGAFEPSPLTWLGPDAACVALPSGALATLRWQALPPRVIALMRIASVRVQFDFSAVGDDERQRVLRRFDLVMLRGGG